MRSPAAGSMDLGGPSFPRPALDVRLTNAGIIDNIKNQKKDVESMRKDTECGISFKDWEDFEVGDRIQAYEETKHKRTL